MANTVGQKSIWQQKQENLTCKRLCTIHLGIRWRFLLVIIKRIQSVKGSDWSSDTYDITSTRTHLSRKQTTHLLNHMDCIKLEGFSL